MTDEEIKEKTIKHLNDMIERVETDGYVVSGYSVEKSEEDSRNIGEFQTIRKTINLEISVFDMVGFNEEEAELVITKFM